MWGQSTIPLALTWLWGSGCEARLTVESLALNVFIADENTDEVGVCLDAPEVLHYHEPPSFLSLKEHSDWDSFGVAPFLVHKITPFW